MSDSALDNEITSDNIGSEPSGDTAPDTGSGVDTSAPLDGGAAPADGTSTETGSAQAATPDGSGNGSLIPDPTKTQPALPPEALEWKKRYDGQTRSYQQAKAENDRLKQQYAPYQGLDPNAIRAWQEHQTRAQQQNLPAWDSRNPNNPRFQQLRASWGRFRDAYQRAPTPEAKEAIKQTIAQTFSPEEQLQIGEWEQHHQEFSARFAADPSGTIGDVVQQAVQAELSRYQQTQAAESEVGQWFEKNAEVVRSPEDQGYMRQLLENGTPFQVAAEAVQMRSQLRQLQSQIGQAQVAQKSAEAKDRLLKSEASVSRDQAVNKQIDIYAEARRIADEKKIPKGDPRFIQIVDRLRKNHNL